MNEVIAIDWGVEIVGVLDVLSGEYEPYRNSRRIEGAQRVRDCSGVIISFNGERRDLPELAKLLEIEAFDSIAEHYDMSKVCSEDRWPPRAGTQPILGQCLEDTFQYYFKDEVLPAPPLKLVDDYEISNWADCFMASQLWKKLVSEPVG